jgi:hypothetical protein
VAIKDVVRRGYGANAASPLLVVTRGYGAGAASAPGRARLLDETIHAVRVQDIQLFGVRTLDEPIHGARLQDVPV